MHSEAITRRLLATIATALGAQACAQPPTSTSAAANATSAPTLASSARPDMPPSAPTPLASAPPTAATTSSVAPTSGPVLAAATVSPTPSTCTGGGKLETYCMQPGTRPPQIMRSPSPMPPMDSHGCIGSGEIVDTCNGVRAVLSGPTFDNRKCCYTVCRTPPAPCGRPLLIGHERQGRIAHIQIDASLKSAIAAAWLADACMEHASVASFARFSLELLAVGAPLDMLADAQRAGLDEVAHTHACLKLARAFDGAAPAPLFGALNLAGLEIRDNLASVAAAAVVEGCCGETFAAMALAQAAANCTDPANSEVIASIAEDEMRHAELAFRFVAWAVATGGDVVQHAVREAFGRARNSLAGDDMTAAPAQSAAERKAWQAAGRLTASDLTQVRRQAVGVLGDAQGALLGQARFSN
jgi:hypothetical protein